MKKASGSRLYKRLRSCLLGAVALAAMPGLAQAQAWVDGKGSLSGAATYIGASSDDLVDPDGSTYDGEDLSITNHTLTLGFEYVPLAKLGVSLELPLLAVKYGGIQGGAFPPHGEYDDGDYHFTPTDARLGVRYQVLDGLRAVSPHLAVSVPMTDYPITGYAGGGRGIIKGHLGVSGGILFDPWVPNLFFHTTAEYTIGTKPTVDDPMFEKDILDEYSQNYMDFTATLGYFIGESVTANVIASAHYQQDGVTFNDVPNGATPGADQNVLFKYHDAVLDEDFIHVGADLSYAITDALSLSAHFRRWAIGANTRNLVAGGIGLSYSLRPSPPVAYADENWSEEEWNEEEVGADAEVGAEVEVGAEADGAAEMSDDSGDDEDPTDDSDL